MSKASKRGFRTSGRSASKTKDELLRENKELRARLEDAEATVQAIQSGGVDALIVSGPEGDRVFALEGADYPYRVMMDVMNEGVVTLGADGGILSCNARFAQFVKLPVEQILGKPLADFTAHEDRPKLLRFLEDAAEESGTLSATLAPADGSTMPVNLSAGAFDVGELPALCLVVMDMTEIFAAAKARLLLASIVETSNDAITGVSLDNTIMTWNAAAERIYGYSAQEVVGQPISIVVPRDRMQELELMADKICAGHRLDGFETVRTTKTGASIYVSLTASPLLDAASRIIGMSVIARDITERKKSEAELERHRHHLEEMVQQRTHEVAAKSDELQAANEELQAQREELEVTNEELIAQSEELQSQREELSTSNQELQTSREREAARAAELQAVLDTMPTAVLIASDPDARVVRGNRAAESLLRVPQGADLSRAGREIMQPGSFIFMHNGVEIPPEELPVQLAARKRAPVRDYEYDVVFWDGSIRNLIGNATPLTAGGAVGAFIDITERKRAEDALQRLLADIYEERDRFSSVLNSMSDEVWFADMDRKFSLVNPAAEREFLIDANDLPDVEALAARLEVYRGDGSPRPACEVPPLRALAGEVIKNEEEIIRTPGSGELRHRQVSASPVHDVTGKIIGSVSVVRDITERKLAEVAVRRNTGLLEGINSILNAGLTSRTEEELGYACLEVAQRLTHSKFGFMGKIVDSGLKDIAISNPGWDACSIVDSGGHKSVPVIFKIHGIYGRVLAEGKSMFTNDPVNHPDRIGLPPGHPPLDAFLGVPLTRDGKTIGMIAVANREGGYTPQEQEIVEALAPAIVEAFVRKEAEDEIARSNKELEQFAYVASHDLQEPLRQVVNFAQLLEQSYRGQLDDTAREFIDFMTDGARRMQSLIQDLLAYSRVGRGGRERIPADLGQLLAGAVRDLKMQIEQAQAVITHDSMPTLNVDATLIVQVFQNLIGNALKFRGEAAPRIHVGARREGNTWLFSVKDNGIGFDQKHADRIFQLFQRLHSRRGYPGTGIGLPICRRVIEYHGGRIWAESEPGQGSTFYFTIPA